MSRVEHLAMHLDRLWPAWPEAVDLGDSDAVLDQMAWWAVEDDVTFTFEVLALAVAEREVFSPWGEAAWREAVSQRLQEPLEERVVRAWLS